MKHTFFFTIISAALVLTASSCKKEFLGQADPNAVTVADYFTSENDVLTAVNGAYQSLRSNAGMAEGSGLYTEERSDNTGRNDNQSNAGEPFQFNDFSLLPSNTYLQNHWNALYKIINAANFALAGADIIKFNDPDLKSQYSAEAKFVRALAYFDLVRKWGAVALVTKPVSSIDEAMQKNTRVSVDSVYAQIVNDLTDAADSKLPDLQPVSGKGRASRAAANALLGKVYLTMASALSSTKRADNLQSALHYLTASYNMRTFGTLSEIPYADVFDVDKKTTCPELLFQIEYKQGDKDYSSSIAASNQAKGETTNSLKPGTGSGGNVKLDLIKDYESGDLRKDFSVNFAKDPTVNDWYITKFKDKSALAGTSGYGGNDWILLRYADVILLLAEVNMDLGNNEAAISFLDQVRQRAGLQNYKEAIKDPAYTVKYPTLKLAILHERRVELAFENQRLYDLLRDFTPEQFVAYIHAKDQADYGLAKISNCGTKDYYYPIPFKDNNLNPEGMYQNPGY